LCFQDRLWCVFEFVVLPEKSPSGQKNWKRHLLHDRRNVEHAYFRPARHNGHGLFLKMVQMHRRTDIRRSKEFDLHAIAVSMTNDGRKR
jgi:hypothetical protein